MILDYRSKNFSVFLPLYCSQSLPSVWEGGGFEGTEFPDLHPVVFIIDS